MPWLVNSEYGPVSYPVNAFWGIREGLRFRGRELLDRRFEGLYSFSEAS